MIIKPGWLIAMFMLWAGIQLIIMFGNGIQGQAVSMSLNNQPNTSYSTNPNPSNASFGNSPVMDLLFQFYAVTKASNPIAFASNIISANWGAILGDLWAMTTFQSNWLTGAWQLVASFVGCIYAGVWLSMLLIFVTKGLG